MKKKHTTIFSFLLLILLCTPAFSQVSTLSYSEDFPENVDGSTFIKLLKNGNTLLIQWKEKGYSFKLYGADKKKIAEEFQPVTTGLTDDAFFKHDLKAVLELNNEIAFFMTSAPKRKEGRTPVLTRVLLDAQNGKLKKSEELLTQEPLPKGVGYAIAFGDVGVPDFYVEKDLTSNYYVVVVSRTFAKEMKDRIQVIHYDPAHKEINNAYFKVPEGFNQIAFRSFTVKADKYVLMITEPYVREHRNEGNKILISKLTKGSATFVTKEFNYGNRFEGAFSVITPEPLTDNYSVIMRILQVRVGKESGQSFDVFFLPINGEKFEIGKAFYIKNEKVSALYQGLMGSKKNFEPYNALIQDYLIDGAGNRLVLSEITESISDSQGLSTWSRMHDMGFTAINKEGKEVYGIHIPYFHFFRRNVSSMIYYPYRYGVNYGLYTNYTVGPGFVKVVAGKKYNYIFFNDTEENRNTPTSDKMTVVNSFSRVNTYYYKIDNKTGAVTKGFLFGTPTSKDTSKLCFFDQSMFNEEKGEFGSVYLDINEKGKKHSGIVWFKLE